MFLKPYFGYILPFIVNETKLILIRSLKTMLRPLVRILIRYGLSSSEFAELIKQLYVDVADNDYRITGKKQTISRIAVLTGLCRKEVQKIKNQLEQESIETSAPVNRANRVIMGWLKDEDFLDELNKPASLPIHGDIGSFDALVKRYSGDITSRAILDELLRIGAVEVLGDKLQLLSEGYIPKTEEEKINVMAKCARDLLNTIDFNLTHPSYEARFQRQIKYVDLSKETIKEFREYSKERSIELMMELNLWLAEHKRNQHPNNTSETLGEVGFGLYYFEEDNEFKQYL